jgi:hypothetical protein
MKERPRCIVINRLLLLIPIVEIFFHTCDGLHFIIMITEYSTALSGRNARYADPAEG